MDKKSQFEAVLLLAVKSLELALRQIDKASGKDQTGEILKNVSDGLTGHFQKWLAAGDLDFEFHDVEIDHPQAPELNFIAHLALGRYVCGISLVFFGNHSLRELVHCTHEHLWSDEFSKEFSYLNVTEHDLETFRSLRAHRCYDDDPEPYSAPIITQWF